MKTALVAGATGLVGKQLINELISNDGFEKIIVIARRELSISHPKLEVRLINFDLLDELQLSDQIEACYCSLGTTQKKSGREGMVKVDYEYVLNLAQLCKRLSISKFLVVSSQGANYNSSFFYLRTKGQMEEAVKKSGVETVYVLRPSLITGEREEFRFSEEMGYYLYKGLQPLMVGKLKKLRAVSGLQIARCMIDLSQDDAKGNFTIESDFIQSY